MHIKHCTVADIEPWARLRALLWPEQSFEAHREELIAALLCAGQRAGFLALAAGDEAAGFAEVSLRRDSVNGCDTSPVLFLEGIYVRPPDRRKGVARSLCKAAESWGTAAGCVEFGSDAPIGNAASHGFHAALGFAETERVVFFRKLL